MIMKLILKQRHLILFMSALAAGIFAQAQEPAGTKREIRKNMVVKEYKTDGKGQNKTLETEIRYNEKGLKTEEIEYAPFGIESRTVYEYDGNDRCVKEILYDDRDKIKRIRKIEYNQDGTKKAHYNYYPNGRLYSTKQYEYSN